MAEPVHWQLSDSARLIDRAHGTVEESIRSLRQRLPARRSGRTLPDDHWFPAAAGEPGTVVHPRILPGTIEDHAALVARTVEPPG